LHLGAEQTLTETFTVERGASSLHVELRSADASIIGQRTLPAEGTCDELAQAAAVVLSAWLTDVHPDFAGALPSSEPEPAALPTPAPPPAAEPQPEPAPVARSAAAVPAPSRERPSVPWRWELGIAAGAELAGGQLAPEASLFIDYGALARGLGVVAAVQVSTSRSEPLGPGSVGWRRSPLALGPRWRFHWAGLGLDGSAGPVMAWLQVAGTGFDDNSSQNAVVWGAFANARIALRRLASTPWAPFSQLSAQVFPGESMAYVSGLSPQWPLPSWSLSWLVGVSLTP
jgi:hypothetical protein